MIHTLIADMEIESGPAGQERQYKLKPRAGGKSIKQCNYQIVIEASCEDANLRVQLELWHGPDGIIAVQHPIPVNYALGNPGTPPVLLNGDSNAAQMIAEYLHVIVKIKDGQVTPNTRMWARIKVYETRKPF